MCVSVILPQVCEVLGHFGFSHFAFKTKRIIGVNVRPGLHGASVFIQGHLRRSTMDTATDNECLCHIVCFSLSYKHSLTFQNMCYMCSLILGSVYICTVLFFGCFPISRLVDLPDPFWTRLRFHVQSLMRASATEPVSSYYTATHHHLLNWRGKLVSKQQSPDPAVV